jgi:hypothetical protein
MKNNQARRRNTNYGQTKRYDDQRRTHGLSLVMEQSRQQKTKSLFPVDSLLVEVLADAGDLNINRAKDKVVCLLRR